MLDLLLHHHAGDPHADPGLLRELEALDAALRASVRQGAGRIVVGALEAEAQRDPGRVLRFDERGHATLLAGEERTFHAGRFEVASLAALRARAAGPGAKIRLWVLDGACPATDVGSLQAHAGKGALFQAASQFNCLESPGPYVTKVSSYFHDPTQGPRASISAFPGTFVRHYAAPGPDGGRFVQTTDGRQIELLAAVCDPGVASVRNGYLMAHLVKKPAAFAAALEERFEQICVGVHDDVQVALGFAWEGEVESAPEPPRIGQVFTSTLAGGGYSGGARIEGALLVVCRQLLRAAYLGTLLAAAALGRTRVVLTLIGGGVFSNPIPLIWASILESLAEAEQSISRPMDVVINGRDLRRHLDPDACLTAVRARRGALVVFDSSGAASIYR